MQSGHLRHRVTLQSRTTARGDAGGYDETWVNVRDIWVGLEPTDSNEFMEGQRKVTLERFEVSARYAADITTEKRLVYLGRVLAIESAIDVGERHRELKLVCVERK